MDGLLGGGGGGKGYAGPPSQIIGGRGAAPLFLRLWFRHVNLEGNNKYSKYYHFYDILD